MRKASVDIASRVSQPFALRSGPGGRHSQSGIIATVFGASGFLGRYIVNELGSRGSLVYIPYRGCELEVRHLRQMFDHGQLGLLPFSPRDEESIKKSIANSDVVINMIGKDYATKHIVPTRRADGKLSQINYSLHDTNVKTAETIARLSREAGVKSLIHVSALGCSLDSPSEWHRTKAEGEIAVRREFPEAIIVRPSTVFGAEDRYLRRIAELADVLPVFPLLNEGKAETQPVHSLDVGNALMRIVNGHKQFAGKTFQLAGPEVYTYREAVEYVMDVTFVKPPLVNLAVPVAKFAGSLCEYMLEPSYTSDIVTRMTMDILPDYEDDSLLSFDDLGITPGKLEEHSFDHLFRFRPGGHFRYIGGFYSDDGLAKLHNSKAN